jgi:hypothetical protein
MRWSIIKQCELITKDLTPEHYPELVKEVWDLRRLLERMPRQLYIQSRLLSELVCSASEETALYFAQRRPREIGRFEWTIDAKDPRRITSYETGGETLWHRCWKAAAGARP